MNQPSAIYWMRTADVYPDGGYGPDAFMAFDPEVRFPRFHMVEGDETIGNVHLIEGGIAVRAVGMVDDRRPLRPGLWRPHQRERTDQGRSGPPRHRGLSTLSLDTARAISALLAKTGKRNPVRAFGRAEHVDYKNGVR